MKKMTMKIIMFFLTINLFIYAQNQKIMLWENGAPGTETKENNEEWNEAKTKVTHIYQPDLTVYLPENSNKKTPAIIVCAGGGYSQIVIEKEGYKLARWLKENGIAAFVLKYRLEINEALMDAQRAISLIRSNAEEFNIEKNNIGIMGFSAGAHLSYNLCVNYDNKKYNDIIDSVSSRSDFWIGVYGGYSRVLELNNENSKNKESAPNLDIPPTFLVHAGNDSRAPVEESVRLYLKLKELNVPAELHVYEFGEHGFALETNRGEQITSTVNSWSKRLLEWLKIRDTL